MIVQLFTEGRDAPEWEGTLDAFLADNDDLDGDNIRYYLDLYGTVTFGGGAAPRMRLDAPYVFEPEARSLIEDRIWRRAHVSRIVRSCRGSVPRDAIRSTWLDGAPRKPTRANLEREASELNASLREAGARLSDDLRDMWCGQADGYLQSLDEADKHVRVLRTAARIAPGCA